MKSPPSNHQVRRSFSSLDNREISVHVLREELPKYKVKALINLEGVWFMPKIAIIGGSGFYSLLENFDVLNIETPFGESMVEVGSIENVEVAFLNRHGKGHKIPPFKINYRANIYALSAIGVERIIATNAVGSIRPEIKPGDFVLPDDFLDLTKRRDYTFYDGETEIFIQGKAVREVVHISMTPSTYCPEIRDAVLTAAKNIGLSIHDGGVYVATEGNRFETPAEIRAYSSLGGTIVGMTGVPEAVLARELCICYSTVCLVTNYAAGISGLVKLTHEEVAKTYAEKLKELRRLITTAIKEIPKDRSCPCKDALRGALVESP